MNILEIKNKSEELFPYNTSETSSQINKRREAFVLGACFGKEIYIEERGEVEKGKLEDFLMWVDKDTYFFQDNDVTISQIVREYLNKMESKKNKNNKIDNKINAE